MITVQWTDGPNSIYQGQEYMDAQYSDALLDYQKKKNSWAESRIIMEHDDDPEDWIIIKTCTWK